MQRVTKTDVRKAFDLYVELTGDRDARLVIESPGDGATRYRILSPHHGNRIAALGAADAWAQIHRYCDGYRDGMRRVHRVIEAGEN